MINNEDVLRIASLANLEVVDIDKMCKQFNDIVLEMDKIKELEIESEIMFSPCFLENQYGEDEILPSINCDDLFNNSKNKYENYIKVVKVVE